MLNQSQATEVLKCLLVVSAEADQIGEEDMKVNSLYREK